MKGKALRGNKINYGEFGLVALEPCWIKSNQIEAARIAMTRYIKRGGKVWIKIFPDKPVTAQPAETRMGSGKGSLEYWVAVVKPGRVMFEIAGVPEETAREALRLAMHKLPCKCKVVSRADSPSGIVPRPDKGRWLEALIGQNHIAVQNQFKRSIILPHDQVEIRFKDNSYGSLSRFFVQHRTDGQKIIWHLVLVIRQLRQSASQYGISAKTDDRCQRSRGQIPSPAFFLPAHNFRAGISDGQYHRQNPEKPVIDIDHSKFSQDIFHRKWIVYRKGQKNSGCYEHIPLFLFSF